MSKHPPAPMTLTGQEEPDGCDPENPVVDDDLEAVSVMCERAEEFSLLVEVVHAFGSHRANGDTTTEAARCALYDWDI